MFNFLGGKCVQCGSTEKLEIDHINPEEKSFTLTDYTLQPWWKTVKELKKCQLLCKKCHKEKSDTYQTGPREHGTWAAYNRGKCRCEVCKAFVAAYQRERRANLEKSSL